MSDLLLFAGAVAIAAMLGTIAGDLLASRLRRWRRLRTLRRVARLRRDGLTTIAQVSGVMPAYPVGRAGVRRR